MIIPFTVYEGNSGKILRTGNAPADMVKIQAGDGEKVVVGKSDDECDWVHPGSRTIRYNHITTREEIIKNDKIKLEAKNVIRKREDLIQNKIYEIAERELKIEGIIE
jgi:hypothetical protein